MKKIIIGAMLVALSAPVGMQNADARGRVAARANRGVVEMVGQAYAIEEIQTLIAQVTATRAILAQIVSTYQGIVKALSDADPSYKDLLKTSFNADEATLKNLERWLNTVVNTNDKEDFRRLGNEVDKTICALNACRLIEALTARYEEKGIAEQQEPTSKMGRLKAKFKRGKEWLKQEYKEHENNKLPVLREKMEDARQNLVTLLKGFDANTATLEEVTNLRQAVNDLYSAMNSYYSTSGKVDRYNAKDVSSVDENIEKLKELSADYQKAIEEMTRPEFNGNTTGNPVLRASEKVFDKLDQIKQTLTDESAIQEKRRGFARKVVDKAMEETGKATRKVIQKAKNHRQQQVVLDNENVDENDNEIADEIENNENVEETNNNENVDNEPIEETVEPAQNSDVSRSNRGQTANKQITTNKKSFFGRLRDKGSALKNKMFGKKQGTNTNNNKVASNRAKNR